MKNLKNLVLALVLILSFGVYAEDTTTTETAQVTTDTTTETPIETVTPIETEEPENTETTSPESTETASPESTEITTPSETATTANTINNTYNIEYKNIKIDKRVYNGNSTEINVGSVNINCNSQITAKNLNASINLKGSFYKKFKLVEGKNIVKVNEDGHLYEYEIWAYGNKYNTEKEVDTQSEITLDSNTNKNNIVKTTKLPQTGESSSTPIVASGILVLLIGIVCFRKFALKGMK